MGARLGDRQYTTYGGERPSPRLRAHRHRRRTRAQRIRRTAMWAVAGLLLTATALAAGTAYRDADRSATAARTGHEQVTATIVAPPRQTAETGWAPCARVRYCTKDGVVRELDTIVSPLAKAGQQIRLWVDRAGRIDDAPAAASPVRRALTVTSAVGLLVVGLLVATGWGTARWALSRDRRVFDAIVAPLRPEASRWLRDLS